MEKINFRIQIRAPKEIVWRALWNDDSYRSWTRVFSEGSHAVTDWQEGSKILFLDGKGSGMVSKIEASRPNEFMSFKHLGEVRDGIEDVESERVKAWAGCLENYSLEETDGVTTLAVEMDTTEDFKSYFQDTWPKALEQLKILTENKKEA